MITIKDVIVCARFDCGQRITKKVLKNMPLRMFLSSDQELELEVLSVYTTEHENYKDIGNDYVGIDVKIIESKSKKRKKRKRK